jgi:hypothetical protein
MMDRRSFLKVLGAGLPAIAIAEKVGLIERVRSYFFAPAAGWPGLTAQQALPLMLEKFAPYIHEAIERDWSLGYWDKMLLRPEHFKAAIEYSHLETMARREIPMTYETGINLKIEWDKALLVG